MRIMVGFDFPGVHTESITAARIINSIEQDCGKVLENGESCWIDQIIEDDNTEIVE